MTRFHFRMATLLRLRESARDERRLELADSQRADAQLQSRQDWFRAEQRQIQCERRAAAGPGEVDLPRLIERQRYAAALRAQAADTARQREILAEEINRRRQSLVEADRDVQTLEKLRENQRMAHRLEEERQEGKRLDEAALQTINMEDETPCQANRQWT
jgi:flagellar protein FliJ